MNRIFKSLSVAAVLLAAGMAAPNAHARGVGAFSGKAPDFADSSCFSEYWDGVVNNCSTQKRWDVPLAVDLPGSYPVTVHAYGATPDNNVGCQAFGVDAYSFWSSPVVYLASFGSEQTITLIGAYVPPGGVLFAPCWVNPGGQVEAFNW
jgi:hypothetical protein